MSGFVSRNSGAWNKTAVPALILRAVKVGSKVGATWIARVGTAAALSFAFITPAFLETPAKLPGVALGSELLWYLEVAAILLAISCLALILLVRGVWQGTVPQSISREGMEWPEEVAEQTDTALAALQAQIDSLERDLAKLASRVVLRR